MQISHQKHNNKQIGGREKIRGDNLEKDQMKDVERNTVDKSSRRIKNHSDFVGEKREKKREWFRKGRRKQG